MRLRSRVFLSTVFVWLAASLAEGVILFRTGDPSANTTAPTGDLLNSGWQHEGTWGSFLGTPISPHYFISAQHFGYQGNFIFNNVTYTVIAAFDDPQSDLRIVQVAEEFPTFAPLYSRLDEVGQRIAEFGRGTQRGAPVMLDNYLRGWDWGSGDGVLRWGENIVSSVLPYGTENDLLAANFDANGLPNECHLSSGDSGGAAFINDNGVWKLAGINYAVDGPFYTDMAGNGSFFAALFDARGFYTDNGSGIVLISGAAPVPTALYPTRISRRLPWIARTVAAPVFARQGSLVTLTFTRLIIPASDLVYTLQQSSDLVTWTTATATEVILSSNASVETVQKQVPLGTATRLFLRLQITQP